MVLIARTSPCAVDVIRFALLKWNITFVHATYGWVNIFDVVWYVQVVRCKYNLNVNEFSVKLINKWCTFSDFKYIISINFVINTYLFLCVHNCQCVCLIFANNTLRIIETVVTLTKHATPEIMCNKFKISRSSKQKWIT